MVNQPITSTTTMNGGGLAKRLAWHAPKLVVLDSSMTASGNVIADIEDATLTGDGYRSPSLPN